MDIHSYLVSLLRIRSAIQGESSNQRNRGSVNAEAELKVALPAYLHVIDEVPEDMVT